MTLTVWQFVAAVIIFAVLWAMGVFTAKAIVERQQRRRRRAWDTFHAHTPRPVPARRHASLREPFDQEQGKQVKKLVKWVNWFPSYMIAASTLIMVCANVFGADSIPWIVVALPSLAQLAVSVFLFAMFGAVMLWLQRLTGKAAKK